MKPNIVMITPDQLRFDCLHCYGNPVIKTPNLDRLADEGVRFEYAYAQNPVCQPSRASIMTGRYIHEHGVVRNVAGLPLHEKTLMHYLSQNGYLTAAVGKMHMYPKYGPFGFKYLDLTEGKGGANDNYRLYLKNKGLEGMNTRAKGEKLPFGVYTNALPAEDYIDSYIGRKAVKFIYENKVRPFFLWVGFCGPHPPFDPPEPYDKLYSPEEVPLPPKFPGDLENKPMVRHMVDWYDLDKLEEKILRRIVAYYYGNITLIDEWIGKILQALEKTGSLENTFILFTTDHGELLGDHGLLWKCDETMYDSNVRVPFIIYFPQKFEGRRVVKEFVESVDIMPTSLELAGIEIPYTLQGRSLIPLLTEEKVHWREAAFSEGSWTSYASPTPCDHTKSKCLSRVIMVRTGKWKFIYNRTREERSELYNMEEDPHELKNLIHEPKHKKLITEFKEKIFLWMLDTQRPYTGEPPLPADNFQPLHKLTAWPPEGKTFPGVTYAQP